MLNAFFSNQSTNKKPNHMSDLSKLDAMLHKTPIKVLRLNMCTSMISSSKIADLMWRDSPFSRKNKTTEWAVGGGGEGFRGDREAGGGGGGVSLDKI